MIVKISDLKKADSFRFSRACDHIVFFRWEDDGARNVSYSAIYINQRSIDKGVNIHYNYIFDDNFELRYTTAVLDNDLARHISSTEIHEMVIVHKIAIPREILLALEAAIEAKEQEIKQEDNE